MTVPHLRPLVLAVVLALAPFVAACGEEERTGLLSQTRATQIKDGLADVEEAVQDGSCVRVREELGGLRRQLGQLPESTDPEVRDRLEEGIVHLEEIAPLECEEQQPETTPETTPDPETTPEVPTEPVPTEPVPTTPPVTPVPDTGEGEGGGGGGEETPGNGTGPPGGAPPGQDSGGEEAPGTELE